MQLGIFLLVWVILAGAWFGFWGVRKLVLTEEGSVDAGVAYFVEWAILIVSAVLILQVFLVTDSCLLAIQLVITSLTGCFASSILVEFSGLSPCICSFSLLHNHQDSFKDWGVIRIYMRFIKVRVMTYYILLLLYAPCIF